MQTQYNMQYVIKEENRKTWRKNLSATRKAKMTHYENKLKYKDDQRDPSNLIYPLYLGTLIEVQAIATNWLLDVVSSQTGCTTKDWSRPNVLKCSKSTPNTQIVYGFGLNSSHGYGNWRGKRVEKTKRIV